MSTELDLDDVAATSPKAAAELEALREGVSNLNYAASVWRAEVERLKNELSAYTRAFSGTSLNELLSAYPCGVNELWSSQEVLSSELAAANARAEKAETEFARLREGEARYAAIMEHAAGVDMFPDLDGSVTVQVTGANGDTYIGDTLNEAVDAMREELEGKP